VYAAVKKGELSRETFRSDEYNLYKLVERKEAGWNESLEERMRAVKAEKEAQKLPVGNMPTDAGEASSAPSGKAKRRKK
jgi:hypothetical protein